MKTITIKWVDVKTITIKWVDGTGKINLVKLVRQLTGYGLKDSKDMVEAVEGIPIKTYGRSGMKANSMTLKKQSGEPFLISEIERARDDLDFYGIEIILHADKTIKGKVRTAKQGDCYKGNHVFELPNISSSRTIIDQMRSHLNTNRFRLRVQDNGAWLGVKIQRRKGNSND